MKENLVYQKLNIKPYIKIWVIVYLFFVIYQPPLLTINVLHLCTMIAVADLLMENMKESVRLKEERYFFGFYILLCSLLIFTQLITQNVNFEIIYEQIIKVIEIFICAFYVIFKLGKYKFTLEELLNILILTAVIQSVFAIAALLDSGIKDFFLSLTLKNTGYNPNVMEILKRHRMYGLCTNFTYTMPMYQAICALFSVFLYLRKGNFLRVIVAIPLILSGVINARNTIPLLLVGGVLIFLFYFKYKYSLKRFLPFCLMIAFCFVLGIILVAALKDSENETIKWILKGIEEIKSFLKGENEGYFEILEGMIGLGEMTLAERLFGIGRFIMGDPYNGYSSDVGFVNYIYLGGFLYSVVLYAGIIYALMHIGKEKGNFLFLVGILAGALVLGNIKGQVFGNNEMMVLLCLIYLAAMHLKSEEKQ